MMSMRVIYYIGGEEVTARAARAYYDKATAQLVEWYAQNSRPCQYTPDALLKIWHNRFTEKGADKVHSVTAIDEQGGLEVITEEE